MTSMKLALRYARALLSRWVALAILVSGVVVFVAALIVHEFRPPQWIFVVIVIIAFAIGGFQVYSEEDKAHRRELNENVSEGYEARELSRDHTEMGDIAKAIEGLQKHALETEVLADDVDATPNLSWELQEGRQYAFSLSSEPNAWWLMSQGSLLHGPDWVEPFDTLPSFEFLVYGRITNDGASSVSVLKLDPLYFDHLTPFRLMGASDRDDLPFNIRRGESIPVELRGTAILRDIGTKDFQLAARLRALSDETAAVSATLYMEAVSPDGKLAEIEAGFSISVRPLVAQVIAYWREHDCADLLRLAGAIS